MSANTATEWTILNGAHEALRTAVRGVAAEDWDRPTPCSEWTVTQVLQHAAGDQIGFAAFITGGTGAVREPVRAFRQAGRLSPVVAEEAMKASAEAWATVDRDAQEVSVPGRPARCPPNSGSAPAPSTPRSTPGTSPSPPVSPRRSPRSSPGS